MLVCYGPATAHFLRDQPIGWTDKCERQCRTDGEDAVGFRAPAGIFAKQNINFGVLQSIQLRALRNQIKRAFCFVSGRWRRHKLQSTWRRHKLIKYRPVPIAQIKHKFPK